jgi:hypothetical protein
MGFTIFETDNISDTLFDEIILEIEESTEKKAPAIETPTSPAQTDNAGIYFLDLINLQLQHPEISSKKALKSFIQTTDFDKLEIICCHVPPWFDNVLPAKKLTYNTELLETNKLKVTIQKEKITSIYQSLKGIVNASCYKNGCVRDCLLDQKNIIPTRYGNLIPKYGAEEVRRKYNHSLSFYQNGAVKSISLEYQTDIETPIGTFPAELISFYENGSIKRLFPLNGKISGYWTEADEKKLCRDFLFDFTFGSFSAKIISLYFYETGSLKAMTLWPGESIILTTYIGLLPVKIGFSLYEDGKIKSVEPATATLVSTPIGEIYVCNNSAQGLCGDNNSLCFSESGQISSLVTSCSKIAVFNIDGSSEFIEPLVKSDLIDDNEFMVIPIKVSFFEQYVKFEYQTTKVYDIRTTRFTITNNDILDTTEGNSCEDCSTCGLCL